MNIQESRRPEGKSMSASNRCGQRRASLLRSETAPAGRLDHEHIAGTHFHFRAGQFFAPTVRALHILRPVARGPPPHRPAAPRRDGPTG